MQDYESGTMVSREIAVVCTETTEKERDAWGRRNISCVWQDEVYKVKLERGQRIYEYYIFNWEWI